MTQAGRSRLRAFISGVFGDHSMTAVKDAERIAAENSKPNTSAVGKATPINPSIRRRG